MIDLSQYKNLTDWALRACSLKEITPTLAAMKDRELEELNKKFGTSYQRKHIDNWLGDRKPVPKNIREHWINELIEVEVGEYSDELSKQLRRLMLLK